MQSRQLLLECFACQIFNSDISFTSTSTSTFITLVKSVQKSHQPPRAQSEKTLWRLEIILRSIFIMKRAGIFHDSANNRGSWSRKSDCVTLGKLQDDMLSHTRRKNSLDSQSAFCTHSAVCSQHFVPGLRFVSGLQSACCTNRYPWHQFFLVLVTVIRTTPSMYHKISVCELIRHFRSFPR